MTYYVEWTLGEFRESSQMHVVTHWDDEVQRADRPQLLQPRLRRVRRLCRLERRRAVVRGRPDDVPGAEPLDEESRRDGTDAALAPDRGGSRSVRRGAIDGGAPPGETREITCILGEARSLDEVHALVRAYRGDSAVASALLRTKEWWDGRLGALQVHTPELAADFLVNRWLLYQSLSCRMWGRSALYQSGGAFGFRDQLQDVMAFVYACPSLAREHILLAAGRQFKEGDVQHWWHPPGGVGIRSRISDDLLWLPYVVSRYVDVTGDAAVLGEMVGFLDAPQLKEDQSESLQGRGSRQSARPVRTLPAGVARSRKFGSHGLPLIGSGDWNDGMNFVGPGGKGESVWLAWFMADVLRGMGEMSSLLGRTDLTASFLLGRTALIERVEDFAWDGEWYLRATFDDGTPLGSSTNVEARIDSLPQSWAWLSGAARPDRAGQALESAWKHLVRADDALVLLFDPPFNSMIPSPGYIKGYPPGVRENGGQYTHAAVWLAIALARERGRHARGEHSQDDQPCRACPRAPLRVAVRGRAVCAGGRRLQPSGARGEGWVVMVHGVRRLDVPRLGRRNPRAPGAWRDHAHRPGDPVLVDGFSMSYRHGESVYEIQVENPEHCEKGVSRVELDGKGVDDGVINLGRELLKHRIVVRMGEQISILPFHHAGSPT